MKNKTSLFLTQKKLLKEAGCEDYEESAKFLFSKAFNIPLDQSYKYQSYQELNERATFFSKMVSRRAVGEPTAQIISSRCFWNNDFYVDKTVLDPRPESELIISIAKVLLFDGMKVLDLGCGSGCIGLSLYQENSNIRLFLADFSKKALNVAKKNALALEAECKLIHTDLFSNIDEKFDLIVANLPYIAKEDFFYLQKEIILYEPHEALYGGVLGLDVIQLFLRTVGQRLNKNGIFVMEFGKDQDTQIKNDLLRFKYRRFDFHKDMDNIKRAVCVKKDT